MNEDLKYCFQTYRRNLDDPINIVRLVHLIDICDMMGWEIDAEFRENYAELVEKVNEIENNYHPT